MPSEIVNKNLEIAKFYYQAQQYFRSIVLLCETVATCVQDKGFAVTSWYSGKPLNIDNYNYASNRGACLPRHFRVVFKPKKEELARTVTYAFFIWFFSEDPESDASWVPSGFISKAQRKEPGDWQFWPCLNSIAEQVRPCLLSPRPEHALLSYSDPWPEKLKGNGIDELSSLNIVPFSLSAISNSDDIAALLGKVIPLMELGKADELKADEDYFRRFLGVEF